MTEPLQPPRRGTQPLSPPTGGLPGGPPPAAAPSIPGAVGGARGTGRLSTDELRTSARQTGTGNLVDRGSELSRRALDSLGDVAERELDALGHAGGAVLRFFGADRAAARVERVAHRAGTATNRAVDHAGDEVAAAGHHVARQVDPAARAVEHVAQEIGEAAAPVVHAAQDVVRVARDAAHDLRGTVTRELLDGTLGAPVPEYRRNERVTGLVGEITSRLRPGHGAFVTGNAGVTIPSETLATALSLGMGGELIPDLSANVQATASAERLANGRVRVVMAMRLDQGASWSQGVGIDMGLSRNGRNVAGLSAGGAITESVTASSIGQVVLEFDPRNPEDARRLSGMFTGGEGSTEVNPAGLGAAFQHNMQSTSMGARLAGRLGVHAGISAGVANNEESEAPEAGRAAPTVRERSRGGFTGRSSVQRTHQGQDALGVNGLGTGSGPNVSAEFDAAMGLAAGGAITWRRDRSTQVMGFVALNASASANGSVPLLGSGGADLIRGAMRAATGSDRNVDDRAAIKLDLGPDGNLRGAAIELTHNDASGRSVEIAGSDGSVRRRDANAAFTSTRIELTPAGLAALRRAGADRSPQAVIETLRDPANYVVRPPLEVSSSSTVYNGHFRANLGFGRVDVNAGIGGGVYEVHGDGEMDVWQRDMLSSGQ